MIDQYQAGRGYGCAEQGERLHVMVVKSKWLFWGAMFVASEPCVIDHMIFPGHRFQHTRGKGKIIFIPWLWNSKANKIVACMSCKDWSISQELNDAYVMIQNVARAWDSWLPDTIYFMSIACLVMEIFDTIPEM